MSTLATRAIATTVFGAAVEETTVRTFVEDVTVVVSDLMRRAVMPSALTAIPLPGSR